MISSFSHFLDRKYIKFKNIALLLCLFFSFTSFSQTGDFDCSGVINGLAYVDDCENCVGGNTGLEPCNSFTPTLEISFSNLIQGSPSDISFTISQDANETDIASSVITTNSGSFGFLLTAMILLVLVQALSGRFCVRIFHFIC